MKKKGLLKIALIALLACLCVMASACQENKMKAYYSQESNYITATGTISHLSCDTESKSLYIGFSDLSPSFDDTTFKIVGKNFDIVQEKGISDFLQIGSQAEFITAPMYFGDGYVMPIVSISISGETFLEFEEGFLNLGEWLD